VGFASLLLSYSVHITVCGLVQVLVRNHLVLDGDEYLLNRVFRVPIFEHRELGRVNLTILLVYRGNVDLRIEFDVHRDARVLRAAGNRHEVNTVVELRVRWANNGAIPVCETLIVTVIETVGDRLVAKLSFFSFFKLLI